MLTRDRRTVRLLVAAAGLAVCAFVPAYAGEGGDGAVAVGVATAATEQLSAAADLLAQGRPVRAKAILAAMTAKGSIPLIDMERDRLYALLGNAQKAIKKLGPIEASLQNADEAALIDDLVSVTRHAQAVIASPDATNAQSGRAQALLASAVARRAAAMPEVPARLAEAEGLLEAGHADKARTVLEGIVRLGIEMDPASAERLTLAQDRALSPAFASAGMFQPGVIKKREPQPQPDQPADQPAAQPTQTPSAPASAPAARQPEPSPQPEAQPLTEAPAVQPDIIAQAQRFEAASILAEADAAYDRALLSEAASKYRRVVTEYAGVITQEQRTQAQQRLAEANARMNANPGQPGSILPDYIQTSQIAHDQTVAEFNNDVEQARLALSTGDATRARDLAASANLRLNTGRQNLAAGEFEAMRTVVNELRTEIDRQEEQLRARNAAEREEQLAAEARRNADAVARNKEERIAQAIDRVRALQREMKYEEALQVTDEVLFYDPINPTALVLRDVLQDVILAIRGYNFIGDRNRSTAEHGVANVEATIPVINILDYPEDWPAISELRGEPIAFADTEDNRRALATLDGKRIPVEFVDTPLSSVVNFIQAVTNLNIDVDYASLEAAGIDRDSLVTMKVSNASVRTVLDRVLEKVSADSTTGAGWSVQDGILVIASRDVINRDKNLQIYDIRDLLVEVPDYGDAPQFNLQAVLQATAQRGGGGGGQSPFNQQNQQNNNDNRRTLEDRTTDLINIITTNVDSQGWQENGGDVGFIQQLSGNLIITQTPANHREVQGLLRKLRETRAMQINVETRFLLVSQDFFEQVGIDLDVYFNGNNNQVRTARATIPTSRPRDFFDFTAGGLQTTYPGSGAAANTIPVPLPSPLSVVGTEQNTLGIAESLLQSDFGLGLLSGAPALGVAGQFLDDLQVDFLVKATQADRRTVTLTAPRLTFTNGQTSNIYVATQVSFVSDLTPIVSQSAVGFDPQLGVVNEGVRLVVDGVISADRRYVTLNVDASVAKIEGFVNTPVTAVAGGQLVNSAATASFIQRPTVTVTQVQTTVTVPDQGTILLGGQRLVTESETESGVPVLSKIPILNRFFSNRVMAKEEQTLLILLKPTVLIQNEEEERHFPGLPESLRMPFSN